MEWISNELAWSSSQQEAFRRVDKDLSEQHKHVNGVAAIVHVSVDSVVTCETLRYFG